MEKIYRKNSDVESYHLITLRREDISQYGHSLGIFDELAQIAGKKGYVKEVTVKVSKATD